MTNDNAQTKTFLALDTKLETFNQYGEYVAFAFHPDLTGHFSGLVVGHPDTVEENGLQYVKTWKKFIADYTEFAHCSPPQTFHEYNNLYDCE